MNYSTDTDKLTSITSFGSVDMQTGKVQKGFINKKGRMEFRDYTFWEKIKNWFLFKIKEQESWVEEYLGFQTITVNRNAFFLDTIKTQENIALYRLWNPITKEEKGIAKLGKSKREFDLNAYQFNRAIVFLD